MVDTHSLLRVRSAIAPAGSHFTPSVWIKGTNTHCRVWVIERIMEEALTKYRESVTAVATAVAAGGKHKRFDQNRTFV